MVFLFIYFLCVYSLDYVWFLKNYKGKYERKKNKERKSEGK